MSFSLPSRSSSEKNSAASETASAANFRQRPLRPIGEVLYSPFAIVTALACGLSRCAVAIGAADTLMYFSSWLICGVLLLVRYFSSSSGIRPSNVPPYF